jgi:hypothetical protein
MPGDQEYGIAEHRWPFACHTSRTDVAQSRYGTRRVRVREQEPWAGPAQ